MVTYLSQQENHSYIATVVNNLNAKANLAKDAHRLTFTVLT